MPQGSNHSSSTVARFAITLLALVCGGLLATPFSALAQKPPGPAAKAKPAAQRPIVLAQVVPLSGPLAAVGRDVSDATQAYVDLLNRAGGIGGRTVELVIADDGNDPKRSTAATLDLINKHEPVAFVNCFGTVGCLAQVDALRASGTPMIGPIAGAPSLRTREQRHVFSIRPDAASEVRVLAEHLRSIGSPPITVVYQDDGFGRSYLPFAERVLQDYGLAIERVVRIVPEKPDYTGAAKSVGTGSKALLLLANVTHSVGVLRALSAVGVEPLAFNLAAQANADFIKRMTGVWTYSVFATFTPNPWRRALASAREYQGAWRTITPDRPFSYLSFEAYLNARVLGEALTRAGRTVTAERLMTALETMPPLELDGLVVNFGIGRRQGASYVDLAVLSSRGQFRQ